MDVICDEGEGEGEGWKVLKLTGQDGMAGLPSSGYDG